jgi:lipopolysaccharide biosynthesis glycosyltransferase/sulfatase maturation enzyme AslB (radical SAM superfamily)
MNPNKSLSLKFCEFHTDPVVIENYEGLGAEELQDLFNKNVHLSEVRRKFEERRYLEAGCHAACEWMSRFRQGGGAYGGEAFLREDYRNEDGTFDLQSIYLVTGSDCNIRCRYCMDTEKYDIGFGTCNVKYTNFIVDYIHGGGKVLQTGGEPFLPRFGLMNKLKSLAERENNKGSIDIFTNGMLLTEEVCEHILAAPVGLVGFSMDTCRPELFNHIRRGADFDTVLANAKTLLKKRDAANKKLPKIVILCAVMRSTALHLEETADFFISNGFCIKPNILFRSFFASDFTIEESLDNLSEEELAEVYRRLLRCEEKYSHDVFCSLPFKGQLLNVLEKKLDGECSQSAPGIKSLARRKNVIKEIVAKRIAERPSQTVRIAAGKDIHIAYSLDDRFAEMTCVSMASVLTNTVRPCVFHIIESRLSKGHIEKFNMLKERYPHGNWKYYHIEIDDDTYVTTEFTKVTKETYAKAMLPDLLSEYERVIWLDGDTVIEEDITALWEIDLDEYFVGMIPDVSGERIGDKKAVLEMVHEDKYYNTGVIVMNLNALRAMDLPRLLEEKLPELHGRVLDAGLNWYAEQDMLNYILQGRVKRLPLKYNCYIWQSKLDMLALDECAEAIAHPVILHYIGADKPTEFSRKPFFNPLWDRYFHYKKSTPYGCEEDDKALEKYHVRESNMLNSLMVPELYDFLCHNQRKNLFEFALEKSRNLSHNKKTAVWGFNVQTPLLVAYLKSGGVCVDAVVDGLSVNCGVKIFDLTVQSPDILRDRADEYFVLLDMRSAEIAAEVAKTLKTHGYSEECRYHIYSPIYEDCD